MLDNVSWGEFLKVLGIVLTCYYGYVLIRYFRSDVSSFLAKRKSIGVARIFDRNTLERERSSMDKLEALLAEISGEVTSNAATTVELIQLLRQKLIFYELPDSSAARKILVNHLLLAAKVGQVDLKEEDLLILFNDFLN